MEHSGDIAHPTLTVLTPAQLEKLHQASLRILAETGVNVHSAELRELLAGAGARVRDDLRVHLSPELVCRALETAPSRIDIYDRHGDTAMELCGRNCYFGTGSDLEYTLDVDGTRRRSTLDDVARSARLCQRLEHIDFVMSYALPDDIASTRTEIQQLEVMLHHTAKPIIMTVFSGSERMRELHELACASCGGADGFRTHPNYIVYGQFVSPLQHDADALDRLIFCADHHVPLIYVPTIMMGASGPVTLAGALALANAECLAGLVMHQVRAPGAPFIYGGCVSPLDMKTTVFTYGAPEWRLADAALSQLSLRYDLPVFGTGGATDARAPGIQAGAEWAYSLLSCALAGTNLIHDVGYLESGLVGSLASLVICDEIVGMVKRMLDGFGLSDADLALDVTRDVGPAGHFMGEDHTLARFRQEVWYPSLFSRSRYESWQAEGAKELAELARQRVAELLN